MLNLGDGTDTIVIDDTSFTAGDITLIAVTSAEVLELSSTTAETTIDMNSVSVIDTLKADGAITGTRLVPLMPLPLVAGTAANNAALIINGVESDDTINVSANMTGGVAVLVLLVLLLLQVQLVALVQPVVTFGLNLAVELDGNNAVTIGLDGGITIERSRWCWWCRW